MAVETIPLSLTIVIAAVAVVLLLAGGVVAGLLRKLLVNTVLGLAVLVVLNLFGKELGLYIPITLLTLVITALFGLAGVGVMIVLALAGIKV